MDYNEFSAVNSEMYHNGHEIVTKAYHFIEMQIYTRQPVPLCEYTMNVR